MSFDFKSIELFVRAAALGAIGRAGAELGYSTTSASQRLKLLEADLGINLFNRSTRAVSLTTDGRAFLDHAKRILDNVEEARESLNNESSAAFGTLRVTASDSFARIYIVPYVPEFLALYPALTLDLNLTDNRIDIVEQGYDLAFRIGELPSSSLLAQKIDDDPLRLVASPGYLTQRGRPEHPSDLAKHNCFFKGNLREYQIVGRDGQVHTIRVNARATSNLGDAIATWVKAGMGIGVASLWHAGPDLSEGRLEIVLPDYRPNVRSCLWAVRSASSIMPKRVQVFLNYFSKKIVKINNERYRAGQFETHS